MSMSISFTADAFKICNILLFDSEASLSIIFVISDGFNTTCDTFLSVKSGGFGIIESETSESESDSGATVSCNF